MFYSVVGGSHWLCCRSPEPCIKKHVTHTHTRSKRMIYIDVFLLHFEHSNRTRGRQRDWRRWRQNDRHVCSWQSQTLKKATSVITAELTVVCECVFGVGVKVTPLGCISLPVVRLTTLTASRTSCEQQKWKLAPLPVCLSFSVSVCFLFCFSAFACVSKCVGWSGFKKKKCKLVDVECGCVLRVFALVWIMQQELNGVNIH